MSALDGELTFATLPQRLPALRQLSLANAAVDLSQVSRMDSAGAAFLLELARRSGGRLTVTRASPQVQELLRFLGLDEVLRLG